MQQRSRISRRPWTLAFVAGVALLATGCGYDNPGEPRTPAAERSARNLGDVHVYCVEREHVVVTECDVDLAAGRGRAQTELRRWWLRAARSLHAAGSFTYEDGEWRFGSVFVEAPDAGGHMTTYGWRCDGDARHTRRYAVKLMIDRVPGGPRGIGSLAAARSRGCVFAPFPDETA